MPNKKDKQSVDKPKKETIKKVTINEPPNSSRTPINNDASANKKTTTELENPKKKINIHTDDDSDTYNDSSDGSSSDDFSQHGGESESDETADDEYDDNETVDLNEDEDDEDDKKDDDEDNEEDDIPEDIPIDQDVDKDTLDDDCVYRPGKKKNKKLFDDDDDVIENDFFEEETFKENVYVSEEDRITTMKLTKYERVRIISDRAKQLSMGAATQLVGVTHLPPEEIAIKELYARVCPIIIKRTLPSGEIELIDVNTLKIVN